MQGSFQQLAPACKRPYVGARFARRIKINRKLMRLPQCGCMKKPHNSKAFGPAVSRFSDVMAHTDRYALQGVSRLAVDAGVSPASISRLIHGKMNPSFLMVARITEAFEREFGLRLDPRDLIAERGRFLTPFACNLCGCRGCLPENALDEFGSRKPAFEGIRPGQWVTSRHPKGWRELGGSHE